MDDDVSRAAFRPGATARIDRRDLLVRAGAIGLAGAAGAASIRGRAAAQATPGASPDASPTATGRLDIVRHPTERDEGEPTDGGELRLFLPSEGSADFQPVAYRQDFTVAASYLDPLLRVDPVTMTPEPWLAESWSWNDDRTQITYRLRPDVTWHDGTPLNAVDVRFSLFVGRDDLDSQIRNFYLLMREADALDDLTLRVTLSAPDVNWLLNASTQPVFYRGQYAEYWQSKPEGERTLTGFDWEDSPPIGTGPWVVDAVDDDGRRISLARNADYWAGPPHFENLTLTAEPDREARLDAWRADEVDLLWPVSPADLPDIAEEPGTLHVADAASVMFAAFNFANEVRDVPDLFADVRVRQALSLAVDRRRIADEVFAGFLRTDAAGTVAQPWAYDPDVTTTERDLDAARGLLAEAGWEDRDGDGTAENAAGAPLALTVIHLEDARPELVATLALVAEDLAEVGADVEIVPLDPSRFAERTQRSFNFDLVAFAYDLFPGFTDFDLYGSAFDPRINVQGWNPGGYANAEVDAAIADHFAADAEDLDAQRDALSRLQEETNEDLFGLWLGFPQTLVVTRPEVRGFVPNVLWPTLDTRLLWRVDD